MAQLRSKNDVAISVAPLGVAVEEYKKALRTLVPLFIACFAWFSYVVWRIFEVLSSSGWCLHVRWLIIGALCVVGLVAFFAYGVGKVWGALVSIRKPCFELCEDGDVVRAVYSERLGNNVFQYTVAKLRSGYLRLGFEAPPLPEPFDKLAFRLPRTAIGGRSASAEEAPLAAAFGADARHTFGDGSWLNHPVSGYVMNTSLFVGHESHIREQLRASVEENRQALLKAGPFKSKAVLTFARNDVAVHIRLGDILWGHHCAYRPLPVSFYVEALKAVAAKLEVADEGTAAGKSAASGPSRGKKTGRSPSPARRRKAGVSNLSSSPRPPPSSSAQSSWQARLGDIVLVTEDASHEIIARLAARLEQIMGDGGHWKGRIVLQSCSKQEDFVTLYSSPSLVMSISSFAWWAAFLNLEGRSCVVLPDYGLLKGHVWFPVSDLEPAPHDMALRSGQWGRGEDVVTSALQEAAKRALSERSGKTGPYAGLLKSILTSDSHSLLYDTAKAAIGNAVVFGLRPFFSEKRDAVPATRWGGLFRQLWLPTFAADLEKQGEQIVLSEPAGLAWTKAICALSEEQLAARLAARGEDKHDDGAKAFVSAFYRVLEERLEELRPSVLAESDAVVRLPLPSLKRWDGNFHHTVESLFDC